MPSAVIADKTDTPGRLIEALLSALETRGNSGISVRSVALAAATPPSNLYHHFGSLEHLYARAQASAVADADDWCTRQLDALTGIANLSFDAMAPIFAMLIDDWTQQQRRLAFAWRECQLMAARDARHLPACLAWNRLWSSFWQKLCHQLGQSAVWDICSMFFDGESFLHLMRWHRAIDRPALEETCAGWARWLGGALASEGPLRRLSRDQAGRAMPDIGSLDGPAAKIAEAAAALLEGLGMAGLTHRAVAAKAGLTLGVVSYNFRTSAELARAAFETIYVQLTTIKYGGVNDADQSRDQALSFVLGNSQTKQLAIDELMLFVARDGDLRSYRPQLRYARGRTGGLILQKLLPAGGAVSALDGALFSTFGMGLQRSCIGMDECDRRRFMERSIKALPILSRPDPEVDDPLHEPTA